MNSEKPFSRNNIAKGAILMLTALLLLGIILNCANSYRLVKSISRNYDKQTVEKILDGPKLLNGVNTLPLLVPTFSGFINELTGGINQYPLHAACYRDNIEAVEMLISSGADVNNVDYVDEKNTALLVALSETENKDRFKIANILIENGADINYKNAQNMVPLTCCLMKSDFPEYDTEEIRQEQLSLFIYLVEHCDSLDVPEYEDPFISYSNLLDATIAYDNPDAAQYLLQHGYF